MADGTGTRLRADARRNRDQIVATARRLFAEQGPDVPMEEIARRSGVGVGTVYRRFPDRDALVRAVSLDTFERLASSAQAAVDEEPDAWHALCRIMRLSIDLRLSVRLSTLVPHTKSTLHSDPRVLELRQHLVDLLGSLIGQAQRDGALRPDIGPGDIVALVALIIRPLPGASEQLAVTITQRCLALLLDGLAAPAGTAMPARPLALADVTVWSGTSD